MNLKRGGLLFAGVVSSTFSIVNRGTSGRTIEDPLGRQLLDLFFRLYQWEFQDPKMEVLYHIRPYLVGIFPYIGLT